MSKRIDLTGQRFGRLVVVSYARTTNGCAYWLCTCDCGESVEVRGSQFKRTKFTKSCGCLAKDVARDLNVGLKHGLRYRTEYTVWCGIIARCTNPKAASFANYGGRGITMCDEWRSSFEAFFRDMGPRLPGTSIDRIDNNLGYFKENCRWATAKEQANNRRPRGCYKLTNSQEVA